MGGEDVCLKGMPFKGLLNLAVLSLIKGRTMYGAEIYRVLMEKFKVEAPRPVIYGLLRRMEYFGFITSTWDVEGGGPARRVYRITDEGLEYLNESMGSLRDVKNVIDLLLAESDKK
ncbi:MAG: PadR family transcriptional regulator [Nitrososphaeria archaeon]